MRGYSYQVLRSVEVWMELGNEEALFLEGAEDLDRVGTGSAVVEQVKDTAGSGGITLRTPAVIDAIAHAWTHAEANGGMAVSFRYLTTSPIGREQGDPLGLGMPALAAWRSVRDNPTSEASLATAAAVARFLAMQSTLSAGLRAFLAGASAEDVVARVILPLDWIVGEGDIDELRERIERRLIAFGETRGDSVRDSRQALGALHLEAWRRATDNERRRLTRADFLETFEGSTRTAVPNSELNALIAAAFGRGTNELAVAGTSGIERVPPLPPRFHRRGGLEAGLGSLLQIGSAQVQGGTGMGKTSLVAAITASVPGAAWLSLRDATPAAVIARLVMAAEVLARMGGTPVLVLDDLDPGADPRPLERPLAEIAATVRRLGGRVIVTGAQNLPSRLGLALDIPVARIFRMPPFDADGIRAYLIEQGCPERASKSWAVIVEAGTSGHPQLVHARVDALRVAGFPGPTTNDIVVTPQEVLDVRAEARRLVALLPDASRELLLRASLATGRLSREHLIRIAAIDEPVAEPGTVVDDLVGTWLEHADEGKFRVSPLVSDAAQPMRGIDWVRNMHLQLAWVLLKDRTLTPMTVSTLLMHVTVARRADPLVAIVPSLFAADEKIWKQVARVSGIYTHIGSGGVQGTICDDPADQILFRLMQMRIAAISGEAVLSEIIQRSDIEWKEAPRTSRSEFYRFLHLSQLLPNASAGMSLGAIVDYGIEFTALGRAITTRHSDRDGDLDRQLVAAGASMDFASFLMLPLTKTVKTTADLEALLDRVEGLPDDQASWVVSAYGGESVSAGLNTDRLWLSELAGKKEWARFRAALRRAMDVAAGLGIGTLASTIAPLMVRVMDEDEEDPEGAIKAGEMMRGKIDELPPLNCAIAKVMWRRGDLAPALELYAKALPLWRSGRENLNLVSAYRDAGVAAARAGDWLLAADRFRTGSGLLPQTRMIGRRVGLIFDVGHAFAMAGEDEKALAALREGVAELVPLEPISETEPVLSLQKRAGALLQTLIEYDEGNRSRAEIEQFAGVCSIIDAIQWDELKPTPTDFIVFNLVRFEQRHTGRHDAALRYAARMRSSPYFVLRAVSVEYLLDAMRVTGDYGELVADTVRQVEAMAVGRTAQENGDDFAHKVDPGIPFAPHPDLFVLANLTFLSGLFDMAPSSNVPDEVLARWSADVPEGGDWAPFRQVVRETERLFTEGGDWWEAVRSPRLGEAEHIIAALAALSRRPLSPEQVLICHGVCAHYLRQPVFHRKLEASFSEMVVTRWLDVCDSPALLVTPRLTIPTIRAAATGDLKGWARTRAVLTAAMAAVASGATSGIRDTILGIED